MKNVKNGYYINGEIYVNSYDEFMETIENESLSNDEFSYLTIYPNENGKLTFLGNNEGEVGGEIDTVDEMLVYLFDVNDKDSYTEFIKLIYENNGTINNLTEEEISEKLNIDEDEFMDYIKTEDPIIEFNTVEDIISVINRYYDFDYIICDNKQVIL